MKRMNFIRTLAILSILLELTSCKKEDIIDYNLTFKDLLVDSVRLVNPEHPYNQSFVAYTYDEKGRITHMKRINDIEYEKWSYDYFIETTGDKMTISTFQNDSVLIEKSVYYLNSEGYIVSDSMGTNRYYYSDEYLVKRTGLKDSSFYTYRNGNLISDSTFVTPPYPYLDSTYFYKYEYHYIDNYLNNAFYNLDSPPHSFFLGKSSDKLISGKKRLDASPFATIIAERYSYAFDIKSRVIGVKVEFQNSNLEWFENQKIELWYKN